MAVLAQVIASGISVGAIYALVALALVITYKTTDVPNFAQGEMAMISTYLAFVFVASYGFPFVWALIVSLAFAAVLGAAFEFVFVRRAKEPTVLNLIIMTLGFQLILYGIAGWKWGPDQQRFPFPVSDSEIVMIGSAAVSHLNLATIAIGLVVAALLFFFFRFARLGIAMQATQQNPMAARINGIPTKRVRAFAFALSSIIGAIAALLTAPITTLDPQLMWDPLLKGFAAAVLGGLTTLVGAVLGGLMLGVAENLFGAYISVEFKSVVAFSIIVLVLWFRPSGLFGRHYVRKV